MDDAPQDAVPVSSPKKPTPVALYIGLALIPFIALCYKEYRYGMAFPYWDAWHFAFILEKFQAGTLSFADFWAQHNEHRVVFPRLLMFGLARLSGWNVAWELVASMVLGVATFLLCTATALRKTATAPRPWWIVPVFSLLIFSWVQMENWAWGWEVNVFLNTFSVVSAAVLLTVAPLNPLRFVLALCAALVTSFCFANGLLCWIALAPLIILAPDLVREKKIIYSLLWIAAGVLVIQLYLLDYHKPEVSPSLGSILQAPIEFISYGLVYIGAPITGMFTQPAWHGYAPPVGFGHFIPGLLGLAALPVIVWRLYKKGGDYRPYLPWAGLILYVLGSATITAAGRAGFGLEQAMTSRYMTMTTLYWLGLIALGGHAFADSELRRKLPTAKGGLVATLAIVLFLGTLYSAHQSQRNWEQNVRWKQFGWTALLAGHEAPLYLQDLCWDPVELRDVFLPILRKGHWAGFGEGPIKPVEKAGAFVAEAEGFMKAGLLPQAKTYLETALLLDPGHTGAQVRYEELRKMFQEAGLGN